MPAPFRSSSCAHHLRRAVCPLAADGAINRTAQRACRRALADKTAAEHIAYYSVAVESLNKQPNSYTRPSVTTGPAGLPATTQPDDAARANTSARRPPTTVPVTRLELDLEAPPISRLVPVNPRRDNSELGHFERRAVAHFERHPDSPFYTANYDRADGLKGFRYAQPLYLAGACASCHIVAPELPEGDAHSTDRPTSLTLGGPATLATAHNAYPPQTTLYTHVARKLVPLVVRSSSPTYVGIVSVDLSSRIDANQVLLNRAFILAAAMLASSLAVVTFWFITTRLILQPVRVLQETAEKVSQGDLNIRSDISTGDEFQQLSETFNTMLINLKISADQLRSVNKSLDLRLGQLAETNVALYESNRLKSEFLANVSHELRTPLNSILGFADLLKDAIGNAADAKSTRYINNILQSGRNLLDLINDLLDLAKIEAGRMEIRSEPLSLSDLFEGLTTILKPLVEPRRVTIVPRVDAEVPIIHSDPGKLQQVLYNFLSNAIKFSPEAGEIELAAELVPSDRLIAAGTPPRAIKRLAVATDRDAASATAVGPSPAAATEYVRISVTDFGPGIEADKQHVIFEKFRQIDGSVTRTHSGTGLGLAISKELTTLMGGSIGVQSSRGEGATFWIVLPMKVQSGPVDVRGRAAAF